MVSEEDKKVLDILISHPVPEEFINSFNIRERPFPKINSTVIFKRSYIPRDDTIFIEQEPAAEADSSASDPVA